MAEVEFKRDKNGNLIAYEDGKEVGLIDDFSKNNVPFDENEKENVKNIINEEKIKKLLRIYGATEQEIENFIQDLNDDIEEKVEDAKEEFDNNDDFSKWEE